jgi:hypothetical protein
MRTGGHMDIGMLWFDNDKKLDISSKVSRAADYYRHKYGEEPNVCFVHPSMIADKKINAGKILIRSNNTMLPHHFWIGVQQQINTTTQSLIH